ncbi:MAG: flavin reductase [Candidatus Omnitrophica bacterium]|nr:flavin reductase [Candidatus Omnitrophota bacterium]
MNLKAKSRALNDFCYGLYVLTSHRGNEVNGFTASWVSQVSFDPPLVMVAVENNRYTHAMIEESGVFVINVLRDDQENLAKHFLIPRWKLGNKFQGIPYRLGLTQSPILESASAFVECRVVAKHTPGDHTLFVGEVIDAGPMNEGRPLCVMDTPLSYSG